VAAGNTEFLSYLCPNSASYPLLSEATRANPTLFPPPGVRVQFGVIVDLKPADALSTRAWDTIKTTR